MLPRRYELTLAPDLDGGHVRRDGATSTSRCTTPRDEVVLNAIELEIDEAWVTAGGERLDATVALDEETERATLALDRHPRAR